MELSTMNYRSFLIAVAAVLFASAIATAQQPLPEKFRGMYVCGGLPTMRGILRVPLDIAIDGNTLQFVRPLLNLNGTGVVGSELGKGTVDGDGRVRVTSEWSFLGNTAHAEYAGTLTASGGTFTGTQIWRGPGEAAPVVRTCTAAVVPAPKIQTAR